MRKLYSILLGAVCFASLHGFVNAGEIKLATPEEVGISSERLGRLKQNFERLLEEEATGGIQILISRSGQVVMHEHLGMADIEAGRPVTADTLFRVASMTKPIVGVAMMMLYEEGYFSLQDPVSKYIPEFSSPDIDYDPPTG